MTLLTCAHSSWGATVRRGEGFQHRLGIRHQERRWHSFTCRIRNTDGAVPIIELKNIEIVATDSSRWLPGNGDLDAIDLRQVLRQQSLLNLLRLCQLLLEFVIEWSGGRRSSVAFGVADVPVRFGYGDFLAGLVVPRL